MISHQKVPNGGWRFLEERTNTTVVAINWNDLVRCVTSHRKINGINVGDVEGDIDSQIEKNHPELTLH